MKNTTYTVETFHATSGWDMPEWHHSTNHKSLEAARKKKTVLMDTKGFTAREIRIVECTRKVIR